MKMIAAVSENWGIGRKGKLLFSIPGDMRFFREKTMGAAVIMGRTTLESFQGAKPLKGRDNIIMSANRSFKVEGAVVVHDLSELFDQLEGCRNEVYVIGGGSIYTLLEPFCESALVTKVDAAPEADKFFPNLDSLPNWEMIDEGAENSRDGLTYRFLTYRNNRVKARV